LAENALMKFLIKRVIIFFVVLEIINLILLDQKWFVATGLICGTIFGILKFIYTSKFISHLIGVEERFTSGRVFIKFVLSQMTTMVLIAIAIKFNMWFFAGTLTGILLIPAVIMVNSITEALQISHNRFQ
jgi:thiamine transporter ThiT